jgi:hypothetical protein
VSVGYAKQKPPRIDIRCVARKSMGDIGHADRFYLEGIQRAIDPTVPGPLLDLVVTASVGLVGVVDLAVAELGDSAARCSASSSGIRWLDWRGLFMC